MWPAKIIFVISLLVCTAAQSATLSGEIKTQTGQALANAVVVATPGKGLPAAAVESTHAELDQRNREFIPHVLVVRSGTEVSFPNHDNIRHHVYSFSPAKRFEIKLYKGLPPNPVRFDNAGIAALGCNIHDWMLAYVYVSDSPYFTRTDSNGHWRLEVPDDSYRLSIWHPDMEQEDLLISEPLKTTEPTAKALQHTLAIKNKIRSGQPPASLQLEGYKGEP